MGAGLVLPVKDSIQDQQLPITTVIAVKAVVPTVVIQATAEVILLAFLLLVLYLLQTSTFLLDRRSLFRDMFELMPEELVKTQPVMFRIVPGLVVEPTTGILLVGGIPEGAVVGPVVPALPVLVVAMDVVGTALPWHVHTTQQFPLVVLKHMVPEMSAPTPIILGVETAEDALAHKLLPLTFKNLSPILM